MYLEAQIKTDEVNSYIPRKYINKDLEVTILGTNKTINIKIPTVYTVMSRGIVDNQETTRERFQDSHYLGIDRTAFIIEVNEIDTLNKKDVLVIDRNNQIIIV